MIENLVTGLLCYLAVGATCWALLDPVALRDFAVRRYVQRNGRLPGKGLLLLCHVIAILAWPKAIGAVIEKVRG